MSLGRTFVSRARASRVLYHGAEAVVSLEDGVVVKRRVPKGYRIPVLDERLRRSRTRREARLLEKASGVAPRVLGVDEEGATLRLEYVDGEVVRELLKRCDGIMRRKVMLAVGRSVAVLHERNVVHGDLTTSNMIVRGGGVVLVDFGLGFVSLKVEDKAVDVYALRKALESTHFAHHAELFRHFLEGYGSYGGASEVLARLEKVERRGRYKRKQSVVS